MTQTCFHTALTPLVDALDLAVRPRRPVQPTVDAVAAALAPFLGRPDLLAPDQRIGDPAGYRQHLLHVPDDGAYSLVALVWLPGQSTAVHDHIAWCVVGVHEGAEREIRYRAVGEHLVEIDRVISPQGSVAGLVPPGDIHRVANDSHRAAVSLHVYGADLRLRSTSIRRRYELPILDARAA
jgi:3-mercaptopropionate dioxygenase